MPVEIHLLTPDRWNDLVTLFGERGACGGCWCMWWRLRRSEFEERKGAGNRRALKKIVDAGGVPGLIAYVKGEPVGWCSVAPREDYPVLERSRILRRLDESPVWSVVCFFIARSMRRTGLAGALLEGALVHARKRGASIVEGYPVEPRNRAMPDAFAWTGFSSTFRKAGFVEAARRGPRRPVMRFFIRGKPRRSLRVEDGLAGPSVKRAKKPVTRCLP
jgi:GNAT superfamily N-acetyltransferase